MNKLRAAILAAMLALVATPAPAAQTLSPKDYIEFMAECSKRGYLAECMEEHFYRTHPEISRPRPYPDVGRPRVPMPTPRPSPAPTPREWRI